MEWLKDKKNLPIVAGLGVVVLLLAIAAILFETGIIGRSSQDVATTAPLPAPMAPPSDPHVGPPSGPPMPGAIASVPGAPGQLGPPGAPGQPGAPGAPAAKPAAKVPANVAKGPDPFNVPGQKVGTGATPKAVKPAISSFVAPVYIASVAPGISDSQNTPGPNGTTPPLSIPDIRLTTQESQTMRVSGVVLTNGNGIRAVLEANGQSLTVQPGDAVPGGRVISIQADGLTMKADDGSLIHVPIGNGMTGNPQGG